MSKKKKSGAGPAISGAMVLAAGFGKRLRPLTDTIPKPLVRLRGHSLLDRILDRLEAAGVEEVVVNLHHLGEKIEAHLAKRPSPGIVYSHEEEEILETGGGVAKALPLLGKGPFFVCNGDVCWLDGRVPALQRLAEAWDDQRMDALLLMQPMASAVGYDGRDGDYFMDPDGCLERRCESSVAPFLFSGVQLLHPRLFKGVPEGAFSLNRLYDKAEAAGRLWGLRHDGEWFHVGTADALREVEDALHHLAAPAGTR